MITADNVLVEVTNQDLDAEGHFRCPDKITEIGARAFKGCSMLTQITLHNRITKVGGAAFMLCRKLTNISFHEGITEIGISLFFGCHSLTTITLPAKITKMGCGVFWGCESLTQLTLPEGVNEIDENMLNGCIALTQINLPQSLVSFNAKAFNFCTQLKNIFIEGNEFNRIYNLLPKHLQKVVNNTYGKWLVNAKEVIGTFLKEDLSNPIKQLISFSKAGFFKKNNLPSLSQSHQGESEIKVTNFNQ